MEEAIQQTLNRLALKERELEGEYLDLKASLQKRREEVRQRIEAELEETEHIAAAFFKSNTQALSEIRDEIQSEITERASQSKSQESLPRFKEKLETLQLCAFQKVKLAPYSIRPCFPLTISGLPPRAPILAFGGQIRGKKASAEVGDKGEDAEEDEDSDSYPYLVLDSDSDEDEDEEKVRGRDDGAGRSLGSLHLEWQIFPRDVKPKTGKKAAVRFDRWSAYGLQIEVVYSGGETFLFDHWNTSGWGGMFSKTKIHCHTAAFQMSFGRRELWCTFSRAPMLGAITSIRTRQKIQNQDYGRWFQVPLPVLELRVPIPLFLKPQDEKAERFELGDKGKLLWVSYSHPEREGELTFSCVCPYKLYQEYLLGPLTSLITVGVPTTLVFGLSTSFTKPCFVSRSYFGAAYETEIEPWNNTKRLVVAPLRHSHPGFESVHHVPSPFPGLSRPSRGKTSESKSKSKSKSKSNSDAWDLHSNHTAQLAWRNRSSSGFWSYTIAVQGFQTDSDQANYFLGAPKISQELKLKASTHLVIRAPFLFVEFATNDENLIHVWRLHEKEDSQAEDEKLLATEKEKEKEKEEVDEKEDEDDRGEEVTRTLPWTLSFLSETKIPLGGNPSPLEVEVLLLPDVGWAWLTGLQTQTQTQEARFFLHTTEGKFLGMRDFRTNSRTKSESRAYGETKGFRSDWALPLPPGWSVGQFVIGDVNGTSCLFLGFRNDQGEMQTTVAVYEAIPFAKQIMS